MYSVYLHRFNDIFLCKDLQGISGAADGIYAISEDQVD
jgi:hypothetical protein